MTDREKLEIGIDLLDRLSRYDYNKSCNSVEEVLDSMLYNLYIELEKER